MKLNQRHITIGYKAAGAAGAAHAMVALAAPASTSSIQHELRIREWRTYSMP